MIVGHANNHGNRNHLWLLVRRPPKADKSNNGGGSVPTQSGRTNANNGNPKPASGGRHINRLLGEGIYS
jgi:hypothetical protein